MKETNPPFLTPYPPPDPSVRSRWRALGGLVLAATALGATLSYQQHEPPGAGPAAAGSESNAAPPAPSGRTDAASMPRHRHAAGRHGLIGHALRQVPGTTLPGRSQYASAPRGIHVVG